MKTIDVTFRLHRDSNKVEIVGTTDDDLDLAVTHHVKHYVLGTAHIVKANPKRPDTIKGTLNWLETAMRGHKSMSLKDQALVAKIAEMGDVATVRYWY